MTQTTSPGWQPIETAPRDGTRILVFSSEGLDGPQYAVIYWAWCPFYYYEPVDETGKLFRRIETKRDAHWGGLEHFRMWPWFTPEYWMPVPLPPNNQPAAGGEQCQS